MDRTIKCMVICMILASCLMTCHVQADIFLFEDFEGLTLGPFVSPTEGGGDGTDWTNVPPTGWVRDNTTTPVGDPVEFFGWTFMDKDAWSATEGNQNRANFTLAQGAVMVADGDAYDDGTNIDTGLMTTYMSTSGIDLTAINPGTVTIEFDSSWRNEVTQDAVLDVSFDGGANYTNVFTDDSSIAGDQDLGENEHLSFPVNNPATGSMVFRFGYLNASNDWWWAVDNIQVNGDAAGALSRLELTVNRDTGAMTLSNPNAADYTITGYEITAPNGALNPDNWLSIAENYDSDGPGAGTGTVDSDDTWTELTDPSSRGDLSEMQFAGAGNGATLAAAQDIDLGPAGVGDGPWIKYIEEDVTFLYTLPDDSVLTGIVTFTGTNDPYEFGDLDFDGDIDIDDWSAFVTGFETPLDGLSVAEAYAVSDLDGDGLRNMTDFNAFRDTYDAANGNGAFAAMTASVPEPSTGMLALFGIMGSLFFARHRPKVSARRIAAILLPLLVLICVAAPASAALTDNMELYMPFEGTDADVIGGATTSSNGTPEYSAGKAGLAIELANPSPLAGEIPEYVNAGDAANLNFGLTTDFSVQFWVNTISTFPNNGDNHDDPGIMSNKDWNSGGNQGWFIGAGGNGRLQWNIGGGGRLDYDGPGGQINDGQWHHVAWTVDRDGSALTYVDNILVDTKGTTDHLNIDTPAGYETRVGTDGSAGVPWAAYFEGTIDEAAIWSRSLAIEEVDALYQAGLAGENLLDVVTPEIFRLEVNTGTGKMSIAGGLASKEIIAYEIASPNGTLLPEDWTGLGDVDAVEDPTGVTAGAGNDPGETWEQLYGDSTQLLEGFLLGSSVFDDPRSDMLGYCFDTTTLEVDRDITFNVTLADGTETGALVSYVELNGDLNGDGMVDDVDLNLLLSSFGDPYDADDLAKLLENYGTGVGGGDSSETVPEPASALLLMVGLMGLFGFARRKR